MARLLTTVAAVGAGLAILWRFGAFLLGGVARFGVTVMALSLVADIEVPTAAVVFAVLCWCGSQVLTRLRYGYWRRAAARAIARRLVPASPALGEE